MNKYQEAYAKVFDAFEHNKVTELDNFYTLKELVELATPKSPAFDKSWEDEETKDIYDENGYINEVVCECPNCHKRSIFDFEYGVRLKHCHKCGQKILWEDK